MADDKATVSDSDIVLMMAMQNLEGPRLLIERYGGRLKAFLRKRFGSVLQEGELAEALNVTFYNIWRFADRYDESKGSLPSWCIRIAQRAAQSIIRRETGYRSKNLEYDAMYDPAGDPPGEDVVAADDRGDDPRIDVLYKAIAGLPPLQRAIIQADLAADGLADAGRLAAIHGTSKNSIYVSRSKAHEALKRQVEQISRRPAGKRR
jgi:DNA-directed RNA polymerase specialized sigma24 family protein